MGISITPLGFKKPDGRELIRNMDNLIGENAQKTQDLLGQVLPDVAALKALGGLAPGDVSDAVTAALVGNPETDTGAAVGTRLATEIRTPGTPANTALSATIGGEIEAEATRARSAVEVVARESNALHVRNYAKLSRFETALATAQTTAVPITALGHSIVWGVGSDDVNGGMVDPNSKYRTSAWPVVLRKLLARAWGVPVAENFIGLYPAHGAATLSTSPAPSRSASLGPFGNYSSSNFQYGGYNLYAAGVASITIPAAKSGRFTTLDVFYWGTDSGAFNPVRPKVTVDGTVVDGGTTTVVAGNLNVLTISGLTDGTHDIVLSHPGGSTNGCYVFGVIPRYAKGVTVNRIGAPGAKAYDFGSNLTDATLQRKRNLDAAVLSGYSKLVIIEIDTNDVYAQTPVAAWKTQVQEVITAAEAGGAAVLLLGSPPIADTSTFTIPEQAYYTAMAELSDANAHTAFADLRNVFGGRSAAVSTGLYPPASPSTVHPGRAGHALIARVIEEALPIMGN